MSGYDDSDDYDDESRVSAEKREEQDQPWDRLHPDLHVTDGARRDVLRYLAKSGLPESEMMSLARLDGVIYTAAGNATHNTAGIGRKVPPHRPADAHRTSLPAWAKKEEVLQTIAENQVTFVTGGTGSGKTTQVPQFLLEEAHHVQKPVYVVCTQPRRIAATSIAERVAYERKEPPGHAVGYHIRFEKKTSDETALLYCTTGVLLQMLTHGGNGSDAITHLVVDEVHERQANTDFLLAFIKQYVLPDRPDLKLVIMSATMGDNQELFESYFAAVTSSIGHVHIPARASEMRRFFLGDLLALTAYQPPGDGGVEDEFKEEVVWAGTSAAWRARARVAPYNRSAGFQKAQVTITTISEMSCVQADNTLGRLSDGDLDALSELYKETPKKRTDKSGVDLDLIVAAIRYCLFSPVSGSILVFLPGMGSINAVAAEIEGLRDPKTGNIANTMIKPVVHRMHSMIGPEGQKLAISAAAPGERKLILATNIAETSITIPDAVFVIDTGLVREKSYDYSTRVSRFDVTAINQLNADQRAGRVGRCRDGFCFCLYPRQEYDAMPKSPLAELARSPIDGIFLRTKAYLASLPPTPQSSASSFLASFPEPPEPGKVKMALEDLEQLGALQSLQPSSSPSARDEGTAEPSLTHLGSLIARFPLEPALGRLLFMGVALRCLEPIVTLVAMLAGEQPFVDLSSSDNREEITAARRTLYGNRVSDHVTLLRLYNAVFKDQYTLKESWLAVCKTYGANATVMATARNVRNQLLEGLRRAKIVPEDWELSGTVDWQRSSDPRLNTYSSKWPVVLAAITAGSYPNQMIIYDRDTLKGFPVLSTRILNPRPGHEYFTAAPHTSSCLTKRSEGGYVSALRNCCSVDYVVGVELEETLSKTALRTVSAVPTTTMALFGGEFMPSEGELQWVCETASELDIGYPDGNQSGDDPTADRDRVTFFRAGWFCVRSTPMVAAMVMCIRIRLTEYLVRMAREPARTLNDSRFFDTKLLDAVSDLLSKEEFFPAAPAPDDWDQMYNEDAFKPYPSKYPTKEELRERWQDCSTQKMRKRMSWDDYLWMKQKGWINSQKRPRRGRQEDGSAADPK